MANRCFRVRLKGEAGAGEAEKVASELGGTLVRVHIEKGITHVYVSAPPTRPAGMKAKPRAKGGRTGAASGTSQEIGEADVLRLG